MNNLPTKARSTFGDRSTQTLRWVDDDIYPYVILEHWKITVAPRGNAFSQRVNARGVPVNAVREHANLAAALADFGWEIC